MLQLARAILKDPEDPTQCFLLFANQVGWLFTGAWVGLKDVVPAGRHGPTLASSSRGAPVRWGCSMAMRRTEHRAPGS